MIGTVCVLTAIIVKICASFKMGQKYSVNQMKAAVRRELDSMNVPENQINNIISGVDGRIQGEEATLEQFVAALRGVSGDLLDGAKRQLDSTCDFVANMTSGVREGLAELFYKAADVLKRE